VAEARGGAGGGGTFRSFRGRNFRLYMSGQSVSMAGTFMQAVAQAWLVLKLTGSGTALGFATLLQYLPMTLLSPVCGVVADRYDRRRLLICTEILLALEALGMGLLVETGRVELWMVYVLAAVLGLISALEQPVRSTFLHDMVGTSDLSNAVSLNMALNNVSRALGPALAGLIIAAIGIGPCFLINAASFVAVIIALLAMRPADLHRTPPAPRKPRQFREGLRYVGRTPKILSVLLLACVYCGLAWEFEVTLPLVAKFAFGGGAALYGLMMAAVGSGAIIGALGTARQPAPTNKLVVGAAAVSALVILAVSASPTVPLAIILLVCAGATGTTFASSASSLVQLEAAPEMRGRVMGLWAVAALGTRPLGGPIAGTAAQHFGPRAGLVVGALAVLLLGIPLWWLVSKLGSRKAPAGAPALLNEPAMTISPTG
jgi:MFS family permease